MNSVCLAILNYNGRQHLEHLLPTAVAAAKKSPVACTVLVLDNRSTEPDLDWVRQNFPSVRTVVAPENDFLFSYNWLLAQLPDEVVVILNNDLRLDENFLAPLRRQCHAPDVFAVSASSFDWDGTERTIGPHIARGPPSPLLASTSIAYHCRLGMAECQNWTRTR